MEREEQAAKASFTRYQEQSLPKSFRWREGIICFFFALILSSEFPIAKFIFGRDSTLNFSDPDEFYYIPLARSMGSQPFLEFITSGLAAKNISQNSEIQTSVISKPRFLVPYDLTFYLLGRLIILSGISLASFAYLLDVASITLGLWIFWRLFFQFGLTYQNSFFGAAWSVVFPWILSPHQANLTPEIRLGAFQFFPPSADIFPSIPLARFGSTQLSVLLFGLSLTYLLRIFIVNQGEARKHGRGFEIVKAGVIWGVSIYVYAFSFIIISLFWAITSLFTLRRFSTRQWLTYVGALGGLAMSIALPGAVILWASAGCYESNLVSNHSIHHLYVYSLEWILIGVIALALNMKAISSVVRRIALIIFVSAFALHLAFLIQPLTGKLTTPYHFHLFYLTPLFSGLVAGAIAESMSKWANRQYNFTVLLGVVLFGLSVSNIGSIQQFVTANSESQMIQSVAALPKSSVVASIDFLHAFRRKGSSSIDIRWSGLLLPTLGPVVFPPNFNLNRVLSSEYPPYLSNELLLGWIYSGDLNLAGPCPEHPPTYIGDLPTGIVMWVTYQRIAFCQAGDALLSQRTQSERNQLLCDLAKRPTNQITHIIHDTEIVKKPPSLWDGKTDEIWHSTDGRYRLLRVDWALMVEEACAGSNGTTT
jgi:hypothetical protein